MILEEGTPNTSTLASVTKGVLEGGRYTARGVHAVESEWEKARVGAKAQEVLPELNFDTLLSEIFLRKVQSTNLVQPTKSSIIEINLVDIGSGKEGVFIKDLSQLEKNLPQLISAVSSSGHTLHLNIVGVTAPDSQDPQDHILFREEHDVPNTSIHVTAVNYAKTITAARRLGQTLDTLLPDKKIDLFVSTWGLGYFTPRNFTEAVKDVAHHLDPKGKFYCTVWNYTPPGFSQIEFFQVLTIDNPRSPLFFMLGTNLHDNEVYRIFLESLKILSTKPHTPIATSAEGVLHVLMEEDNQAIDLDTAITAVENNMNQKVPKQLIGKKITREDIIEEEGKYASSRDLLEVYSSLDKKQYAQLLTTVKNVYIERLRQFMNITTKALRNIPWDEEERIHAIKLFLSSIVSDTSKNHPEATQMRLFQDALDADKVDPLLAFKKYLDSIENPDELFAHFDMPEMATIVSHFTELRIKRKQSEKAKNLKIRVLKQIFDQGYDVRGYGGNVYIGGK